MADHTPATPPMIPSILMCCVKDVEERGIDEVGIYRVPGNECDANEILDKFMKVPILGNTEIAWSKLSGIYYLSSAYILIRI